MTHQTIGLEFRNVVLCIKFLSYMDDTNIAEQEVLLIGLEMLVSIINVLVQTCLIGRLKPWFEYT